MWLHPAPRATRAATHLWIVLAQHLVSPFTSSSLTGIIRPRRLPLLHTATVTAATTPRVTVADVADVSLAPPSLAHALPRHLPPRANAPRFTPRLTRAQTLGSLTWSVPVWSRLVSATAFVAFELRRELSSGLATRTRSVSGRTAVSVLKIGHP